MRQRREEWNTTWKTLTALLVYKLFVKTTWPRHRSPEARSLVLWPCTWRLMRKKWCIKSDFEKNVSRNNFIPILKKNCISVCLWQQRIGHVAPLLQRSKRLKLFGWSLCWCALNRSDTKSPHCFSFLHSSTLWVWDHCHVSLVAVTKLPFAVTPALLGCRSVKLPRLSDHIRGKLCNDVAALETLFHSISPS